MKTTILFERIDCFLRAKEQITSESLKLLFVKEYKFGESFFITVVIIKQICKVSIFATALF